MYIYKVATTHKRFFGTHKHKGCVSSIFFSLTLFDSIILLLELIFLFLFSFSFNICSLEKTLRSFTCLTLGDTIKLLHNNKEHFFDIIECNPASAVCINETDCEVDFVTPLDYKEPENPQPVFTSSKAPIRGIYF